MPATAAPSSQADFYARHNACMIDRGWTPIESEDGSFSFTVTSEQNDIFQSDNGECLELVGANLEIVKSEEGWREAYQTLVDTHECLVEFGLQLPAPPSFQAWQDDDRRWGPYGDIPTDIIQQQLPELEEACPQPVIF